MSSGEVLNPHTWPVVLMALLSGVSSLATARAAGSETIHGAAGIVATIEAASGRYEVRSDALRLRFAGSLGAAVADLGVARGADAIGSFEELRFRWRSGAAFQGSIRTYATRAVVLFAATVEEPNADAALMRFPHFTEFPRQLHTFSYRNREFSPPSFTLEETGTPWLLFDPERAVVLSPASNFMIASLYGDVRGGLASGLNRGVGSLPSGFRHQTLLVFDSGVNAAWESWGRALVALAGATRPDNDADVGLCCLGYWTDNGASYYYDYEPDLGYAGTLLRLVARYRQEQIPIRYLQLDSWWYYKTLTDPEGRTGHTKNPQLPAGEWNRYGGLLKYEAHPALFPQGLDAFQQRVALPLILHNRWIDPASPYLQRYDISGFAAVDPAFWRDIMAYVAGVHAVTYEQDWLNVIYERSPTLATTLHAGDAFADGMARAASERGVTLQYSMALPRHFLEGARYGNLTSARVSPDRFGPERWDQFLYTSRLASALGIWPWTDVFMSTEADNLLLSTLSAGMVGIGDRMGTEDRGNLLRAVRADGVIVKPDSSVVPVDSVYAADAAGSDLPMVAAAHTDHGALRTAYVFSYRRSLQHPSASFTAQALGITGDARVYDTRRGSMQRLPHTGVFTFRLLPDATAYFVVAPVTRSGITLFGDADKFVPDGRKRIASITDEPQRLTLELTFAPEEHAVHLFGYANKAPTVTAQRGTAGKLSFDPASGRFDVEVSPGPEQVSEAGGRDPVRKAIVSFGG